MLLGNLPRLRTVAVGNRLDEETMLFPGVAETAWVMHGNGPEPEHLFTQVIQYIYEAIIPAAVIQNIMETNIGIDDLSNHHAGYSR